MTEKPDWVKEWPKVEGSIPGKKAREIISRDEEIMSSSYTRSEPLVGEEGWGSFLRDPDGNVFLDFSSGMFVLNYGHSHPYITNKVKEQIERLPHFAGTHYYYELQIELAEKLSNITPGNFEKQAFFANSGAESVEAAFKLARWHTEKPKMVSYRGAFHGRTLGALSLSSGKSQHRKHFAPLVPEVDFMPYPYCYRCPYNEEYPGCDFHCVEYIRKATEKEIPPEDVAALIVEPIQGNSGYITPPPEYYPMIKEICEENDWLFISDEIQAGLGRTGEMFSIEHWGVEPDIITTAKALSGGVAPIGAMVAREEVMDWEPDSHASTFGGNLLGCSAALASLELIEKENLVKKADEKGKFMRKKLEKMKEDHELIGEIRGKGLMIGVELVKNRETKEFAMEEMEQLIQEGLDRGIILFSGGKSSIRLAPPLITPKEVLDQGLDIFEEALTEVEKNA